MQKRSGAQVWTKSTHALEFIIRGLCLIFLPPRLDPLGLTSQIIPLFFHDDSPITTTLGGEDALRAEDMFSGRRRGTQGGGNVLRAEEMHSGQRRCTQGKDDALRAVLIH